MLDLAFVALGFAVIATDGVLRHGPAANLRRATMSEPIIGLVVAVLLGLYLLYTLIRPEKF